MYMVQGVIIFMLLGLLFKERIMKLHYQDRRKRAIFVNLRIHRFVTLDEARKFFSFRGLLYSWDSEFERNECSIYDTNCTAPMQIGTETVDVVQPLSPEVARYKLFYWPESTEFKNSYHNQLFKAMMLAMKGDILMYILIAAAAAAAIALYDYTKIAALQDQLNAIGRMLISINQSIPQIPPIHPGGS